MKKYFDFQSPLFRRRLWMSLLGVVFTGVSVGIMKEAALGVDPFQSFISGLNALIPISYGLIYSVTMAILLVFVLIADRHFIGIATFINLFLLGYIAQFTLYLMRLWIPAPGIAVRLICLAIGFLLLCFSSSLYMTGDMGVSTYDAVALIISGTWHKGQFRYVRIITDFCCVACGGVMMYLAGETFSSITAIIGVGTIFTAFCMGPLIDFFNRKISVPFLQKAEK